MPRASSSATSTSSSSSTASKASGSSTRSLDVPRGPKYVVRPRMVIFRFLDVIKSKHNLLVEMLTFSRANLQHYLQRHWSEPETVALVDELRAVSLEDKTNNDQTPEIFGEPAPVHAIRDSILLYVSWKCLTQHGRFDLGHNCPALQRLLHWVIIEGMLEGRFRIAIPASFVDTFRHLHSLHVHMLLMSSVTHELYPGTRLLSFTDQGNLTGFFLHYDLPTLTRSKESYVSLAASLSMAPADILLVAFSDTECKKAARAGYRVLKIRQRNQQPPKYRNITVVNDISEIRVQAT